MSSGLSVTEYITILDITASLVFFVGVFSVIFYVLRYPTEGHSEASQEGLTASKPKDVRERFYDNIKRKKDDFEARQRKHP